MRRVRLGDGQHGIGRHTSNRIRLDDVEVSRRHARVWVDGTTVLIEDLGSNNGTLLRGAEVGRAAWEAGVEIEVTPFRLVWRDLSASSPHFLVEEGAQRGAKFPLLEDALSVGRGEDQDIVLDDQGASRSHAILVQQGGQWMIRDTGSANGLFLDGRRAGDGYLRPGMRVQIGHTTLRFVDPTAPAAGFVDEAEAPTELGTQAQEPETSLVMPEAPPSAVAASAHESPTPRSTDASNVGLLALVVSVMAIILLLVGVLALVGAPA